MATKKCAGCGERYEKNPDHPPFRRWCSDDCAITIARASQERARQKKAAKATKDKAVKHKADLKRVRYTPRAEALVLAQLLARVSNADDNGYCTCVSCGVVQKWNEMDGGHFIAKGDSSYWALDPRNIFPQCKPDNAYGMKHGTAAITYTRWMVDKFGQDFVDDMIAKKRTTVKRSSVFYADFIASVKKEIAIHKARIS